MSKVVFEVGCALTRVVSGTTDTNHGKINIIDVKSDPHNTCSLIFMSVEHLKFLRTHINELIIEMGGNLED